MMLQHIGEPLQFSLVGPNIDDVATYSYTLLEKLQQNDTIGKIDLDLQLELPQIEPIIDRQRAQDLGLNAQDIAITLKMLTGGIDVARYNDLPGDGERYDIRVKAAEKSIKTINDLKKLYLRNPAGQMVRLDTVVTFKESLGPAIISRFDLQYSGNFFIEPKIPLGEAVDIVNNSVAEFLPFDYSIKYKGQAEEFEKTAGYMVFTFGMATILLFMVLASQFNSFSQPIIIMVAQPLAMIGGVVGLWLFGMTLNIFSIIGMVLLIGLVAKNAILLVDLTNQYRLMTSLTIILVLMPAAIGLGAGSDTNGPLAVAVIGGMITSTLLTLVVIPVVYSLLLNGLEWAGRRFSKQLPADTEVAVETKD